MVWVGQVNNVEVVEILSAAAGTYTVTVSAVTVPLGPQLYALVVNYNTSKTPGSTLQTMVFECLNI